MRELDDAALEMLLRQTLRAKAGPADPSLTAEDLETRAAQRRRRRLRRGMLLMGLAAVIALPASALVVGAIHLTRPQQDGYEAVVVRSNGGSDLHLVAIDEAGRERVLTTPSSSTYAASDETLFVVPDAISSDGWLAIGGSVPRPGAVGLSGRSNFVVHLIDLTGRAAPHTIDSGALAAAGWGPTGRLGMIFHEDTLMVADPSTGAVSGPFTSAVDVHEFVRWTADGRSLVRASGSGCSADAANDGPSGLDTLQVDGWTPEPLIGELDPGTGPRSVASGGRTFAINAAASGWACPSLAGETVAVDDPSGSRVAWYRGQLAPDRVIAASFSADGRAIWLLLDSSEHGRSVALARVDAPGQVRRIGSVAIPPEVTGLWLSGLARDDSVATIHTQWGDLERTIVMATNDGTATIHDGGIAGFVPAASAATWPGGSFVGDERSAPPSDGGRPPLRSSATLISEAGDEPGTLLLAVDHHPSGPAGPITKTTLGPIPLKSGVAIHFDCGGGTNASVEVVGTGIDPVVAGCGTELSRAYGGDQDLVIDRPVLVTVAADPATAWSLVIFDPPGSQP